MFYNSFLSPFGHTEEADVSSVEVLLSHVHVHVNTGGPDCAKQTCTLFTPNNMMEKCSITSSAGWKIRQTEDIEFHNEGERVYLCV